MIKHFGAGYGKENIHAKRAFGARLLGETVTNPDFILSTTVKKGETLIPRHVYLKYWKGNDNIGHFIAVEKAGNEKGKVVTSAVGSDKLKDKAGAFRAYKGQIKKADAIEYVNPNISQELKLVSPSEYPRPTSRDDTVSVDTHHNTTGDFSLLDEIGKVNNKDLAYSEHVEEPTGEGVERLGRPVTRREIINTVNDLFDQRVKSGRLGKSKDVLGWYNRMTKVIRTRNFGDINTLMHELGHHVDHKNGFSIDPKFNTEFSKVVHDRFGNVYDKLGDEGIRKEGYAEFFHDYVSDRNKAKADFPTFYDHFTERLARDKELNGAINKLSKVTHEWFKQAPEERVKGSIRSMTGNCLQESKTFPITAASKKSFQI